MLLEKTGWDNKSTLFYSFISKNAFSAYMAYPAYSA